jgi:hypothetical protein
MTKPHVQQRSPGVIFRIGVAEIVYRPLDALSNCGAVLAV